jgi:hypothetical protein
MKPQLFDAVGRKLSLLIAALALLLGNSPARGTVISLTPPIQSVANGSFFDVFLDISGLGSGVAPSVGAFDLRVLFDPSRLSFDSVAFGDPVLGDQLGPVSGSLTGSANDSLAGSLSLLGISLDAASDVDSLQAPAFALARIRFAAIGVGTSSLSLTDIILGDANGDPLVPDVVRGAEVSVQAVPEGGLIAPGGILLGLTFCFDAIRRRRSDASPVEQS